ncbi:unnamed protein product [Caenorhabditis auriculariae]|uniref:DNA-directed RNA polymerase III subunit RPC5 n=1 Tax=Caenorhabditis auriculariae TaxID=2777116 RepID=A0A8S1GWF9_9PELO|nr:unnamed protein product [Caenorhabditis auriculariae]
MEVDGLSTEDQNGLRYGLLSSGDDIVSCYDVVVCESLPNTELYCVSFPNRKKNAWDEKNNPRARYKKNVRVLEMRFSPDTQSASYDQKKAEALCEGSVTVKSQTGEKKYDDVFEGRAFPYENPICNAVGYLNQNKFYLHAVEGTFEMHRSINFLNKKVVGLKEDGDATGESEDEAPSDGAQLRVKFSRPETERQKKRREASALHREKKIANDVWIPMNVHLQKDTIVQKKMTEITSTKEIKSPKKGQPESKIGQKEVRSLVDSAIICSQKEEIAIVSGKEYLLSKKKIREMPLDWQVRAHMVKAQVMRTEEMFALIDGQYSPNEALDYLQQCSRLVRGVWVLQSDLLFQNLPPAHSNVPGKVDEYRADLWRNARDLALCLIDGGHRVTRNTLTKCFQLSSRDAEEILSTFGDRVEEDRSWRLRIPQDEGFLQSQDNRKLLVGQKRYWVERWTELQRKCNSAAITPVLRVLPVNFGQAWFRSRETNSGHKKDRRHSFASVMGLARPAIGRSRSQPSLASCQFSSHRTTENSMEPKEETICLKQKGGYFTQNASLMRRPQHRVHSYSDSRLA